MIKLGKRWIDKKYMFAAAALIIGFAIIHVVQAVTAEPGSAEDPLVSKSYVDQKISEAEQKVSQIDTKLENITATIQNINQKQQEIDAAKAQMQVQLEALAQKIKEYEEKAEDTSSGFVLQPLNPGQILIAEEGTEIILRQGKALAIVPSSATGGILDLNEGIDLGNSSNIPPNHLLIVPKSDGRGLISVSDGIVLILVKGKYTIQ